MNRHLEDILNQPRSLSRVIDHQFGDGAADVQKAAAAIREARNVVFSGMGSSLFAAIPAACMLSDNGIIAEAVESSELLYYRRGLVGRGTVVVLISRSGDSVEVTKLLPVLREAGANTIGVTNTEDSTLGRDQQNRILLRSDADQMVAIQTYTATVVVLLLLAMEALGRRPTAARCKAVISTLQNTIDAEMRRTDDWVEFIADARAIYLLGRGPSMASVYESALMFNEAARTPSVAMSSAQFRHGPVEVVDDSFRAFVFASHQPTIELDRALAADLKGLGARVETCGVLIEVTPFQPVVEIIPVQFAACRLAESKGITPGQFRYAGQVTTAESGFRGV